MSRSKWTFATTIALAGSIAVSRASAMAPIPDDPHAPGGWHGEVTPYLWAIGVSGTMKIGNHDLDFEKSSTDLFRALDVGGSLQVVVQHDSLVMFGQVDHFDLSTDQMDVDAQPDHGSLDNTTQVSQLAVGYQVGNENGKVDVLVGARLLRMENALTVNFPSQRVSKVSDVTDAVAILRPSFLLGDSRKWMFDMPVVLGAGGSDLAWEIAPQFTYAVANHWAGRFGYRVIGSVISHDEPNEIRVGMAGWLFGFGYRW